MHLPQSGSRQSRSNASPACYMSMSHQSICNTSFCCCWTRTKSGCQTLATTQMSYATISKSFVMTERESYSMNSTYRSNLRYRQQMSYHPTYCTTAEVDISNFWCRRKQYDSSARSIEAAATTSRSQQAPCDWLRQVCRLSHTYTSNFVLTVLKWRARLN